MIKRSSPTRVSQPLGRPIPVPTIEIIKAARDAVDKFEACSRYGVKPGRMNLDPFYVRSPNGDMRVVYTSVRPDKMIGAPPDRLIKGAYFRNPDKRDENARTIVIKARADRCRPSHDWREALRSVLAHELAHAADPYVERLREHGQHNDRDAPYAEYVNRPQEVTARLAQVQHELHEPYTMKALRDACADGVLDSPEQILRHAQTWGRVRKHLQPEARRKFLRLAFDLWQQRNYGRCKG